jgi:hypothetical protein
MPIVKIMSEIITVTQNCVMIFDTNPELKAMGKKTTTITKVIDVTVPPISAVPSYAARTRFFPFPCAYIYFPKLQWHHRRIPTTSDKPNKLIKFKV